MSILQLEQLFDAQLPESRMKGRPAQPLLDAGARWSAAVWAAAQAAGPVALSGEEIERGVDLGCRPVFVCGAHRSGTTLIRDLLDSHPSLAMLPSEGRFFTDARFILRPQPRTRWLASMGCEWLLRLANPINQRPYWLLGRSDVEHSPYVDFARSLMAWWPIVEQRFGPRTTIWPLLAVALAYAHCTGGLTEGSKLLRWGEKTPMNERFLDVLLAQFPQAKVIQAVRNPFAVYASRAQIQRHADGSFSVASVVRRDLNHSYGIAAAQLRSGASDRFVLVRHEDLLQDIAACTGGIAAFLGIEALPILMQPTVAGIPSVSNSSFALDARAGHIHAGNRQWESTLSEADRQLLTAVVGEAAGALGYQLPHLSTWRVRKLRLVAIVASVASLAERAPRGVLWRLQMRRRQFLSRRPG